MSRLGPVMGDVGRVGEAAERVFRHRPRHRQGALDQFGQHLRRAVARRHDRLLLADQHAQPEILAFRAFELLDLAEPAGMRQRDALEQHRVGRIGAGLLGAGDQVLQQVDVGGAVLVGQPFAIPSEIAVTRRKPGPISASLGTRLVDPGFRRDCGLNEIRLAAALRAWCNLAISRSACRCRAGRNRPISR